MSEVFAKGTLALWLTATASAHNKVVVVPLGDDHDPNVTSYPFPVEFNCVTYS